MDTEAVAAALRELAACQPFLIRSMSLDKFPSIHSSKPHCDCECRQQKNDGSEDPHDYGAEHLIIDG